MSSSGRTADHSALQLLRGYVQDLAHIHPYIVGAILGGSAASKESLIPESDYDIRIFIDSGFPGLETAERPSRYGVRLDLAFLPKVTTLANGQSPVLVEFVALRASEFDDLESILCSHDAFALVYSLATCPILHDPTGRLGAAAQFASEHLRNPSHVKRRIAWQVEIIRIRSAEFRQEPASRRTTVSELWNGPIWALMGAGTLLLAAAVCPPTFRLHLWRVREAARSLGRLDLYYRLLEAWGIHQFGRTDARHIAASTIAIYRRLTASHGTRSITVSSLKSRYYEEGLGFLLGRECWRESVFSSVFLLAHCSRVATPDEPEAAMLFHEVLASLGFNAMDGFIKDSHRCERIALEIASELGLGSRAAKAAECIIPKRPCS